MVAEHVSRQGWKAVLFDLDGTLIDTRPGMRTALGAALEEVVGDAGGAAQANLSLPLDAMVRSAAPSVAPAVAPRLAAAFRRYYDAGHWKNAEPYPQARESVSMLHEAGVRVFVVTNKRGGAATRLVEEFGLAPYLEDVVGQPDTGDPLSKSDLAGRLVNRAGLDPATTVVVGDSDQDAAMAASEGMTFIAFTSGAGPLSQAPADQKRVEKGRLIDAVTYVLEGARWRQP
jgi:phosphoglycolate phosphatase